MEEGVGVKMKNNGNVLLINICKEKLHYYEFVKPVKDVLVKNNIKRFVRYYGDVSRGDLERASKVIICGTSLKDDYFVEKQFVDVMMVHLDFLLCFYFQMR